MKFIIALKGLLPKKKTKETDRGQFMSLASLGVNDYFCQSCKRTISESFTVTEKNGQKECGWCNSTRLKKLFIKFGS